MKIKIFAIHDNKAAAYLPPFNLPNTEMAIRTFTDTLNDSKHAFHEHPEDYTLFELADYDDENAVITTHQTKIPLGNGLDFQTKIGLSNVTQEHLDSTLDQIRKYFTQQTGEQIK